METMTLSVRWSTYYWNLVDQGYITWYLLLLIFYYKHSFIYNCVTDFHDLTHCLLRALKAALIPCKCRQSLPVHFTEIIHLYAGNLRTEFATKFWEKLFWRLILAFQTNPIQKLKISRAFCSNLNTYFPLKVCSNFNAERHKNAHRTINIKRQRVPRRAGRK